MKARRQALIREIVESQSIQTQEELAQALGERGMVVTQATVSRDIKEMHLLKVLAEDGRYRYATMDREEQGTNERLIRFFFPERPGALMDFMDAMETPFNCTLFQYRYHGADYGRVLVGFDAPEDQREAFEDFLARVERMGYPHVDETDNPAYKMFLGWHHDN